MIIFATDDRLKYIKICNSNELILKWSSRWYNS